MEPVTVFSETLTATSYADGVLMMSDGPRVIFADGAVDVQSGSAGRRRVVRR